MSAWMLLPFAFGALSFIGVSVFKKIRQSKTANPTIPYGVSVENPEGSWKYTVAQRSQLPPVTGIPAIDKAIAADGGLKAGEVYSFVGGKMPNVTFDLAGLAALDKILQAKASSLASCRNPCCEIPLDLWQGDQFVQNETSYVSSGSGNVSKFNLQHKPIPGTATGTVYVRNQIQTQNVAVATFVAHANGNLHFTPIGTPNNSPHWGHYENGEFQLEWPSFPGNNYIVCSYEYSPVPIEERWKAPSDDEPHVPVCPPINAARWAEIKKATQHKEFSETGKDDFFIPQDGKNVIRLLPPLNGPFHVSRRQHYCSPQSGGHTIQCTKRRDGKNWVGECPICEYYNKLWNDSSESRSRGDLGTEQQLIQKARQLKPVERHYYNVLVNGEVKMFSAGKAVHDQFVTLICGDDQTEAFGDISNPATGRNVTLIKEMKGPFPDYKIIPHRDPTPMGTEPEVKSIMEKTYNLETVAKKWEKLDVCDCQMTFSSTRNRPTIKRMVAQSGGTILLHKDIGEYPDTIWDGESSTGCVHSNLQ